MSVPSWAKIGAKVVCAICPEALSSEEGKGRDLNAIYPENGGIYTIRNIVFHSHTGDALALLRECRNEDLAWEIEPGFDLRHFRPLVTTIVSRSQEQDTAMFRKIASNLPSAKDMEPAIDEALARLDLP